MAKKSMLKMDEVFRLGDWLRKHQQQHADGRPSWESVAEQAQKELGFVVTWTNVKSCHDSLGLKWTPRRKDFGKCKVKSVDKEVCVLLVRVASLLDIPMNEVGPTIRAIIEDIEQEEK